MTTTLLAANAAWTGLVIALWTKTLRTTFDCSAQRNKPFATSAIPKAFTPHIHVVSAGLQRAAVENHMIVTGKIAAPPLLTKKSL